MVGEDRWELVMRLVGATLDGAPMGLGFVGVGVPKGPEGLVGCGIVVEGWERRG